MSTVRQFSCILQFLPPAAPRMLPALPAAYDRTRTAHPDPWNTALKVPQPFVFLRRHGKYRQPAKQLSDDFFHLERNPLAGGPRQGSHSTSPYPLFDGIAARRNGGQVPYFDTLLLESPRKN